MQTRVQKKQVKELKELLGCLALERSGTQKELADRLFAFLKKPSASSCTGRAPPGVAKKVPLACLCLCSREVCVCVCVLACVSVSCGQAMKRWLA